MERGYYVCGKFVEIDERPGQDYGRAYLRASDNDRYAADDFSFKKENEDVVAALRSLTTGDEVVFTVTAPRVSTPRTGAGRAWMGGHIITSVELVPARTY